MAKNDEWVTVNGEDLTVRQYLKILKKKFKKKGLLDKRIANNHFDDSALIYIEDEDTRWGYQSYNYGINHNRIVVKNRHRF